jgi:hypothetical protein
LPGCGEKFKNPALMNATASENFNPASISATAGGTVGGERTTNLIMNSSRNRPFPSASRKNYEGASSNVSFF